MFKRTTKQSEILLNLDNQQEEILCFTNLCYELIAEFIEPSEDKKEYRKRLVDSLRYYWHKVLKNDLFMPAVNIGEATPEILPQVRVAFKLPEDEYIINNIIMYSITLDEINKIFYEVAQTHHKRIMLLLMNYLAQNPAKISFEEFKRNILDTPKSKQSELLISLGNGKFYTDSMKKYKNVSHLILARELLIFKSRNDSVNNIGDNDDIKPNLEKFYRVSIYFRKKLLGLLNSKHNSTKKQKFFIQDDFRPIPSELSYLETEFSNKEWEALENQRNKMWFAIINNLIKK